ncbi:uncharacterized protein J3D65DRAFT_603171 [Phyllosticta citribraziliensis]|uniref:Uncharacterized protein n=1 Tax=Phyllosticta citribraziliensis TaxID=989973 RepID=A0ABR1LPP0_9PEZI
MWWERNACHGNGKRACQGWVEDKDSLDLSGDRFSTAALACVGTSAACCASRGFVNAVALRRGQRSGAEQRRSGRSVPERGQPAAHEAQAKDALPRISCPGFGWHHEEPPTTNQPLPARCLRSQRLVSSPPCGPRFNSAFSASYARRPNLCCTPPYSAFALDFAFANACENQDALSGEAYHDKMPRAKRFPLRPLSAADDPSESTLGPPLDKTGLGPGVCAWPSWLYSLLLNGADREQSVWSADMEKTFPQLRAVPPPPPSPPPSPLLSGCLSFCSMRASFWVLAC